MYVEFVIGNYENKVREAFIAKMHDISLLGKTTTKHDLNKLDKQNTDLKK